MNPSSESHDEFLRRMLRVIPSFTPAQYEFINFFFDREWNRYSLQQLVEGAIKLRELE